MTLIKVIGGLLCILGVFIVVNVFVHALNPATTSTSYQVYANADSTTPGTTLAAVNTSATLANSGDSFRIRMGVSTRSDASNFTQLSTGSNDTCAVSGGAVYCSGYNNVGQLGNNSTTNSLVFTPVSTATGMNGTVSAVSVNQLGSNQTVCSIMAGSLFCWGSNANGQLGVGQTNTALPYSSTPINVSTTASTLTGKTITSVANGDGHTCVIASGAIYCWGANGSGRLGNNSTVSSTSPVAVVMTGAMSGKTPTMVAAGSAHSCAVASGLAYCWGSNANGQLGNASTTSSSVPVAVDTTGVLSGKTVVAIATGSAFTCASTSDGNIYCWGANANGQLGNASTATTVMSPVAIDMTGVLNGKSLSTISAGLNAACTIANDGYPYCWGANGGGDLGIGSQNGATYSSAQAVTNTGVLSGKSTTVTSMGNSAACAIASSQLFCWGSNSNGLLGLNSTTVTTRPAASLTTNIGITLAANSVTNKLQYAQKTAATCLAQTTGWADVTATSAIAYKTYSDLANGTTITSSANDPTSSATTSYETYQNAAGTFTNPSAILPGTNGLWDFSLFDNSNTADTSYCIEMVHSDGTGLDSYSNVAEIKTAAASLSLRVVDGSGSTVASPSFGMTAAQVQNTCQTVTGTLGSSTQRIRLLNTSVSTGWSVSLAATSGPTASWAPVDNSSSYDFNDPSGSPPGCTSGSDGDGIAGQLTINPSTASIAPESGCSSNGVSLGSSAGYNQGTTDAITLFSGSSAAATGCYWDLTGVGVSQTIPSGVPANVYLLNMTATVVSQ